ncbi:MAG TPA: glycosyltransferase family 39 protein [Stenomitos sp.]
MSQLRSHFLQWFDRLGVPLVLFSLATLYLPIGRIFQFNPDEGIELAKVTLYSQGYSLYTEIWNDQPPLFTLALAQWWHWFGDSIVASRLLTLSFSALLAWAFYRCLRLHLALAPALLGTVGLCLTYDFLRLSISVMRGLPALALGMVSAYFLLRACQHPQRQNRGFVLSGLCFALALQTKFFVGLMLPAMIIQLLIPRSSHAFSWQQRLGAMGIWSSTVTITFLTVGIATHALNLDQLLAPHLSTQARVALTEVPSALYVLLFFVQDLDYTLLAGLALRLLWPLRQPAFLFPFTWLLSSTLGLLAYTAIWSHYSPLIAIPTVWLAALALPSALAGWPVGLGTLRRREQTASRPSLPKLNLKSWAVGLLLFACCLAPIKVALIGIKMGQFIKDSGTGFALVQQVNLYRSQTQWLMTDLPILAFYTHLKVPPPTVVLSEKRLEAGDLAPETLQQVLDTYQPEQLVLGLYPPVEEALKSAIAQDYTLVYHRKQWKHYLRNTVSSRV